MTEDEIRKAKEYNTKIYPIYKAFSWDLLFYYSIIYLFLNQAKGLSTSNILLADSFYPLSKMFFEIPFVTVVDKIGKKNSLFLGNVLLAIGIFVLFIFPGLTCAILSNIILAAGFVLKELCESSVLDECITNQEKKRSIFSSIDGKGLSAYYFIDSVCAVLTSFFFVINAYIPIILCFVFCVLNSIIAYKFKNFENNIKENKKTNYSNYFKQLKFSFKYIFKSNRLRNLILFIALFSRTIRYSFYSYKQFINRCWNT